MNYATEDGTAIAGVDYVAQAGSATIIAGNTTTTVTVPVIGDIAFEPNETFAIVFTPGAGAPVFTDNHGLGTIVNDDVVPSLSINDVSVSEGNAGTTNFVFTLTLTNPTASEVTVDFATADGTALAGADYTAQAGTATIAANTLTTTITVPVTGDTAVESDETFFVNLSNPSNATLADPQGLGTILNEDAVPASADVAIEKTTTTTTFTQGQQVSYTITVTNAGPGTANSVAVTDVLPAGATFVSASGAGATCSGTTTVTCTIPTLASGASTIINLVITASGTAPIANTATVSAASPADPTPANNSDTVTITPGAAPGPAQVPTVDEWGLMLLVAALAFFALKRS